MEYRNQDEYEWIYYSSFIRDSYLCTKEGERPRSEREAYLYVDLGVLGGWWADPFGNLKKEKEVYIHHTSASNPFYDKTY